MTLRLYNHIYKKFTVSISATGGTNRMGCITISHRDPSVV